jgi:hypothetical protein
MSDASKRRTYSFAPETLRQLDEFAEARQVKDADVIRDALQLYGFIYKAQKQAWKNDQSIAVKIDRGDGVPAEIMVPELSERPLVGAPI